MKQKISVLVADDKEFMRHSFAKLLCDQEGIQVVGTAVDGEAAVKKAAELKPQVVLLDIRMPRSEYITTILSQNID
ncbi:MAG: response regulator [Chloroflexi bacterium]|nr:response regulator [Chloroflexota bacterium]